MKVVKIVVSVLLILVAILLLVAAVLPSEYRVERSIVINKPPSEVYPHVADLRNWDAWSPWYEMDAGAKYNYSGNGVGSKMSWAGDEVGIGNLTIIDLQPNRAMRTSLQFEEPQMMASNGTWQFEETPDGGTKVTWGNEGDLSYPMDRLFGPFLDNMLGKDFSRGLENLKRVAER